jgi:3-oxoacyl-[acyl-carrier protein] reductase
MMAIADTRPVAMVTGGGTGIGAACCQALADAGFRVGVHYRTSEPKARAVAAALPNALLLRADLTIPADIDAMVAQLKEEAGRVDVLVNNAGSNRNAPWFSMKLEDYDAVMLVVRGIWFLTRQIVRRFMLRQVGGRIINISSVVGHTGNVGQMPYTMAKASLDAFTKSIAQELVGRKILVNSVAPGLIDTEMSASMHEGIRSALLGRVPLGRAGTPAEIADIVTFLATRGTYIHGSVIHANGGIYGG